MNKTKAIIRRGLRDGVSRSIAALVLAIIGILVWIAQSGLLVEMLGGASMKQLCELENRVIFLEQIQSAIVSGADLEDAFAMLANDRLDC